jgi:hypothetical protein
MAEFMVSHPIQCCAVEISVQVAECNDKASETLFFPPRKTIIAHKIITALTKRAPYQSSASMTKV